jgi:ribonuclease PH
VSGVQVEPQFVEVQGTGEHGTFSQGQLDALLGLAIAGIRELDAVQQAALAKPKAGGRA